MRRNQFWMTMMTMGRISLIDSGVDYMNWTVSGIGTTKSSSGIHLVEAANSELIRISVPTAKPNTNYVFGYTVVESTLDSEFALFDAAADANKSSIAKTLTYLDKSIGSHETQFESAAILSATPTIRISNIAANSEGCYVDLKEMYLYEVE